MRTYQSDFVFKIPTPVEISSLRETLERLVSDEELRRNTGTKARDWALQVFTSQAYVSVFEELSEQFLRAKPLLTVSDRIGHSSQLLVSRTTIPQLIVWLTECVDYLAANNR